MPSVRRSRAPHHGRWDPAVPLPAVGAVGDRAAGQKRAVPSSPRHGRRFSPLRESRSWPRATRARRSEQWLARPGRPALVSYYFGSKGDLFGAAVNLRVRASEEIAAAVSGGSALGRPPPGEAVTDRLGRRRRRRDLPHAAAVDGHGRQRPRGDPVLRDRADRRPDGRGPQAVGPVRDIRTREGHPGRVPAGGAGHDPLRPETGARREARASTTWWRSSGLRSSTTSPARCAPGESTGPRRSSHRRRDHPSQPGHHSQRATSPPDIRM